MGGKQSAEQRMHIAINIGNADELRAILQVLSLRSLSTIRKTLRFPTPNSAAATPTQSPELPSLGTWQ